MGSRGRCFHPTPWVLPRLHSERGHRGAPGKGRPRSTESAPEHPQPYLSAETLDPDFRATSRVGFAPSTPNQTPAGAVQPHPEAAESAGTRRVRRALTGESYGRPGPDLPRQQLESHPAAPKHQSWASAPEHRAPDAANDEDAPESRAGAALSLHSSTWEVNSVRMHVSPRCYGRIVVFVLKAVTFGLTFYLNS